MPQCESDQAPPRCGLHKHDEYLADEPGSGRHHIVGLHVRVVDEEFGGLRGKALAVIMGHR